MNLEQQTPKEIKVFISYSHDSADHKQLVLEFANELREWGIDAIIDQYYESSPPSEGWQKWMDRQIAESNFVIVVCSEIYYRRVSGEEEEGKGRGVKWESTLLYLHIYNSDSLNKRFIPVLLPGGTEKHIPIPLQSTTHYRYPESFENLYRQLTQQPSVEKPEIGQLRVLLPLNIKNIKATSVDAQILSNPYRGLEAFREQDAKNFFGRDEESKDLAQLVEKRHFVAVLGSSGSGKSSLVFAGLIPQLRQSSQWLIATCRPQNAPLREISVTLIDALYQTELNEINRIGEIKALTAGLEQQTLALTDIIARIFDKHPATRLLLVIDQFEELYTLSPTSTQSLFLNHLLNFLEQHTTPPKTTVLITLRADFLGYALSHPKLAKLLDTYRNKMLGDLSGADLSLAIEQPARALNVTFEEGLAERIVRDVGERAGSLPLLQFALQQLWERRDQNRLTHAGYEALGTVTQALAHHADQVYERFSETGKTLFRQLFVQMVRPGEGTEDTRQVMVLPADPARHEIIRQLANERLVVTRHDENTGENTVEIAHEALIRHWQRLKAWMKEDRSFRVWQENLRGYMRDQVLLRDAQLVVAQEWVVQRDSELTEAERSFIQKSVAQRDKEVQEREQQRLEKERLQRRNVRVLATSFIITLVLGLFGWWQWGEAKKQEQVAIEESAKAKKQEEKTLANQLGAYALLASQSPSNLNGYYDRALLLAAQAFMMLNTNETRGNLFSALQTGKNIEKYLHFPALLDGDDMGFLYDASLSYSGKILATIPFNGEISLWDVEANKFIGKLTYPNNTVLNQHITKDDKFLVATLAEDEHAEQGLEITWDIKTQKIVKKTKWDNSGSMADSEEQNGLPDICERLQKLSGKVSTKKLKSLSSITPRTVTVNNSTHEVSLCQDRVSQSAIAVNPNGKIIADADENFVYLWDVGKETLLKEPLQGHSGSVSSIIFTGNETLMSADTHGKVIMWDIVDQSALYNSNELDTDKNLIRSQTNSDVKSPNGKMQAQLQTNTIINVVDLIEQQKIVVNIEKFLSYSKIVSIDKDGTESPSARMLDFFFTPNSQFLVILIDPDIIVLWDSKNKEFVESVLQGSNVLPVRSLVQDTAPFVAISSPDSKFLASTFEDVILWDITKQPPIAYLLSGHKESANSLSFSPDGKKLASSDGSELILWDVDTKTSTGQPLIFKHSMISFNQDGTQIITNNDEIAISIDVDAQSWYQKACYIAGRNLSQEEWNRYLPNRPYQKTCP